MSETLDKSKNDNWNVITIFSWAKQKRNIFAITFAVLCTTAFLPSWFNWNKYNQVNTAIIWFGNI